MFQDMIGLLFSSRDFAHRAHLQTTSYAAHKALESFYADVTDKIDELVEAYQGRHNTRIEIPTVDADAKETPLETLRAHLAIIEAVRSEAIGQDSPIQNIVDEICAVYLRAFYQLSLT